MSITRADEKELIFLQQLGGRLAELRGATRYSCADIAKFAGCSKMHITEVERGNARLTLHQLQTYCRVLHVTPNEILGYDDISLSEADLLINKRIGKLSDDQKQALVNFLDTIQG